MGGGRGIHFTTFTHLQLILSISIKICMHGLTETAYTIQENGSLSERIT